MFRLQPPPTVRKRYLKFPLKLHYSQSWKAKSLNYIENISSIKISKEEKMKMAHNTLIKRFLKQRETSWNKSLKILSDNPIKKIHPNMIKKLILNEY